MIMLIIALFSALLAVLLFYFLTSRKGEPKTSAPSLQPIQSPAVNPSDPVILDASAKAREIVLEAKDEAIRVKREAEEE